MTDAMTEFPMTRLEWLNAVACTAEELFSALEDLRDRDPVAFERFGPEFMERLLDVSEWALNECEGMCGV